MDDNRYAIFEKKSRAEAFEQLYDKVLERDWPGARSEMDLPGRFGSTRVYRTGPAEGTPIVLLHPAIGGASAGLAPYVGPLAQKHPVYAIDILGTPGKSVQTEPMWLPRDRGVWLAETLAALHLDRVHLVGFIDGGYLALLTAAQHPERVATVTTVDDGWSLATMRRKHLLRIAYQQARIRMTKDPAARRERRRALHRWLGGVDYELPDLEVDETLELERLVTPVASNCLIVGMLTDSELARIHAPTLVMLCEASMQFDPVEAARRAEQAIPRVTVDMRPGGHSFYHAYPDREMTRVLAFIDFHEAG